MEWCFESLSPVHQMSKAIVYIEEMDSVADVTFPAVPTVVSLLMYDDTARARDNPHPSTGYPIVCVTVSGGHWVQTHTRRMQPPRHTHLTSRCLTM